MKKYSIWIGWYNLGQGSTDPAEPQMVAEIEAIDFKTACMKYELTSILESIKKQEATGHVDSQSYPWFFDHNKISNGWTGKYYETFEEAAHSFSRRGQ